MNDKAANRAEEALGRIDVIEEVLATLITQAKDAEMIRMAIADIVESLSRDASTSPMRRTSAQRLGDRLISYTHRPTLVKSEDRS